MFRNLSEKPPAIRRGYPAANIARLDDAYWEVFEREAILIEGQSLQKDRRSNQATGKTILAAGELMKYLRRCILE